MTVPATQPHEDDVLGKAYDRKLMRRLLVYTRPYRALMYGAFALLCVEGGLQVVGPLLTRRVIDVAVPTHNMRIVIISTALFFLALLTEFVLSYAQTWLTSLLGQRVMRDLRMEIFEHLQRLSISYFDRNPAGRLITRVTSDVETLNELFTSGVVAGFGDLFTLIAISVAMLIMDWRLALASFAVIPFVVMVSGLFRKGVRETYRDIRVRLARINSFLQERLTGMRIVQLFGQERREARRFDELNRSHLDAHLKSITVYALYFPAIELLTSIALAILIVAGAARVNANMLTVGTVAAFLQLVRRFFQPLQDLSEKYNILQTAMASSERIFTLLDTMPSVADNAKDIGAAKKKAGVEVAFEDVWFAYDLAHMARHKPGAEHEAAPVEWVLKGISFTARPGETLALVGHTGAGKTTIVNLLMRFYDPQRGRITINGVDIRTMPLQELRSLIGYVQQDIFLFAGDIATNIRLSNPISDDEVVRAAAEVGADRIIRGFPQGYGQVLGERGASISVGERQLLSFARAIAANAPLLLLDEATSAVDSEIEAEIHAALSVLVAGRTTIAVAHRLSTIANADTILVLHHGEVAERGTHQQLLERAGLYSTLWRLQAGEPESFLQRAG
ncbi:MAG: ATP-binding cassette, subfamily multidrug efflux pump [Gemmatimonadaceae bacterium]|nr:ATP-binding cassette, subfamily multidrug efflux pump [Gemmatimonadaceae bacterium]